jgi:hypothetical protein
MKPEELIEHMATMPRPAFAALLYTLGLEGHETLVHAAVRVLPKETVTVPETAVVDRMHDLQSVVQKLGMVWWRVAARYCIDVAHANRSEVILDDALNAKAAQALRESLACVLALDQVIDQVCLETGLKVETVHRAIDRQHFTLSIDPTAFNPPIVANPNFKATVLHHLQATYSTPTGHVGGASMAGLHVSH